jgi:hypothetical protein
MPNVFPSPLRRSTVGFGMPKIPSGLDLPKIKAALSATAREAGSTAGREAHQPLGTPVKRDYQLKLY